MSGKILTFVIFFILWGTLRAENLDILGAGATNKINALESPEQKSTSEASVGVIKNQFENINITVNFNGSEGEEVLKRLLLKQNDIVWALKRNWGQWLSEKYPAQFAQNSTPKKLLVELTSQLQGRAPLQEVQIVGSYSLEDSSGSEQIFNGQINRVNLKLNASASNTIESQVATFLYNLGVKYFRQWENDIALANTEDFEIIFLGNLSTNTINDISTHLKEALGLQARVRPVEWGVNEVKLLVSRVAKEQLLSILRNIDQLKLSGKDRPLFIPSEGPYKIKLVKGQL